MPYNYLIDPKIRDNYKIDFENSIIILDEAHNIEKVSEDVASFDLNMTLFTPILSELGSLVSNIEANQQIENPAIKFQSSIHNVLEIMCLTQNFMHFL